MLDAKALAQLQSLKSDIKSTTPEPLVMRGTIKGTGRSFGFVIAADATEYFLPPDAMAKVFPGDEVEFTIEETPEGKVNADLTKLVSSPLTEFMGRYVVRGKAQGVEPEVVGHAKWLFVPPKKTADADSGQWVKAKVTRHPWETGKAQAEVMGIIGSEKEPGTWHAIAVEKHQLPRDFSGEALAAAEALDHSRVDTASVDRTDLRDIPFVTIDNASTQDMDDAIYAEETDDGWLLRVAIADPAAWFDTDSPLETEARQRLTTTYLPGRPISMLPERLANDLCSLVPNTDRLALVFHIRVAADGSLSKLAITPSVIRSTAKLSYEQVSEWLDGDTAIPAAHWHLETLKQCCQALFDWRKNNALIMQDRPDYRVKVDDQLNVTGVVKEVRNTANSLVEESMLAVNRIAAAWLAEDSALFMTHAGFRPDREEELKGLLREFAKGVAETDGHDPEGFKTILRAARTIDDFPLLSVLLKRLERGVWSTTAAPHFGLGFDHYTTVTSPIRKYTDLVLHRLIHAKLAGKSFTIPPELADDLNERLSNSRKAANEVENRLRLEWLHQQPEQTWQATVVHINSGGIIAQLDDNGAAGFIDLRGQKKKLSYDPLRMMMKGEAQSFILNQPLQVTIAKIEGDKLELSLVEENQPDHSGSE
ncbi:ribonuclease R family protein [Saccharospirillum impatiens]|uniref:ribonuclease R family protein n=1 Tax=Saccharospirillum impatiens TaxID=169438 RepID=UPI000401F2C1|nr:VacB/RNase II family 3'-5' exoribonuclease [Saccharospirillum impatiens]